MKGTQIPNHTGQWSDIRNHPCAPLPGLQPVLGFVNLGYGSAFDLVSSSYLSETKASNSLAVCIQFEPSLASPHRAQQLRLKLAVHYLFDVSFPTSGSRLRSFGYVVPHGQEKQVSSRRNGIACFEGRLL